MDDVFENEIIQRYRRSQILGRWGFSFVNCLILILKLINVIPFINSCDWNLVILLDYTEH